MSWTKMGGFGSGWLQVAVLFVALSLNLYPCTAHTAKPGDVDTTFGSNGIVTIGSPTHDDIAKGLAIDSINSKGRIVVVGTSNIKGSKDFTVARFNSNGTLDTTFGKNGVVTTDIVPTNDSANAVAIDSNGKIVVVGTSCKISDPDDCGFSVARYDDKTGTLDESFGEKGRVVVYPSGKNKNNRANAVAIDSRGRIVVAGVSNNGVDDDFAVARFKSDGTLDMDFGKGGPDGDGIVTTNIDSKNNYPDGAYAVAIDSTGNIVVAGANKGTTFNFAVARYKADDGTLDSTFDNDGKTITQIGPVSDSASALAIDANKKIVVAGTAFSGSAVGSTYDFAIARYDNTGKLDESFGNKGKVITPIGPAYDSASALAIDSNGKLVVVGTACKWLTTGCDFAVARYDSTGKLDESFGNKGKVITPSGSVGSSASAVAIQPDDGNIVVGGGVLIGTYYDVALVRYIGDPVIKASGAGAGTGSGVPTGGEGGAETTATTGAGVETVAEDTGTAEGDTTAAPSWGDGGCTLIPTP